MLTLKIQKVHKDAILPKYAHEGDSGLDLFSVDETIINPGETKLINTGIRIELPENTEAQVRPRSGLALNHQITIVNTPGTVDQGYRGDIKIITINLGKVPFKVEKGMKIAQMVIQPVLKVNVVQVDKLSDSDRGTAGFGSTGLK